MLRHERRLLIDCLGVGFVLCLLVISADVAGWLSPMEDWLYDLRVRHCQYFAPPPTDQLVHLDIDDRTIDAIGAWPWPRATWGRIFDELNHAAPKVVEMDVLFSDPQKIQYQKRDDGTFLAVDNDAQLAGAIGRAKNVVLPLSLSFDRPSTPVFEAMVKLLTEDPAMTEASVVARLRSESRGITEREVDEQFIQARREAVDRLIARDFPGEVLNAEAVKGRMLRGVDKNVNSPLSRLIEEQASRVAAERAFARFSIDPQNADCASTSVKLVPLQALSNAAAGGAFVDYPQFSGATVRSVPLMLRQGRVYYAQMGLVLACRMLDADLSKLRVAGNVVEIPRAGGAPIRIPLAPARINNEGVRIASLLDIPWVGSADWRTMYDPSHTRPAQHLPVVKVWDAVLAGDHIAKNIAQMDEALRAMYELLAPEKLKDFLAHPLAAEDIETRTKLSDAVMKDAQDWIGQYASMRPGDIDERGRKFLAAANDLPRLSDETAKLAAQLAKSRADLTVAMRGKAVLIGWIATSAVADFVPTPLHAKCPGVVVHGAIFNGIMTGELWQREPAWMAYLVAIVFSLAIAFVAARLTAPRALAVAVLLGVIYLAFNGFVLFDYGNCILGAAVPLLSIGLVWSAGTTTRLVVETAERNRITRRFRNYVDPKLVNYVLEHPDKINFAGERREMTVAFTDLAGFTSLSERLGEQIVSLLNELFGELVPIIRDHHQGYVNKFIGDGIMFFYNAPLESPRHAADAIASVLDMHEAIERFNERLAQRGLPAVFIRAGIASGEMIIGDAGGAGTTDYTVLGDVVNLASRLQSANKATGTRTLINARSAELLGRQFLLRPVGKLEVVGKSEAVMTYEPMCAAGSATSQQRRLVEMTAGLVDAFIASRFDECVAACDEIDAAFAESKLTAMYRALCEQYRANPPTAFDGRIVLTEK